MKHLIIIGARGYGRLTCDIASKMNGYGIYFDVKGFLDDKRDALDAYEGYPEILSSVETYCAQPDDVFVCALGDVNYKKKYIEIINRQNVEWFSVIHPSAVIGQNVKIGKGCIISQYTIIDADTCISDFVCIQSHCAIGHDVIVGPYCMIDSSCFMGGFASLEECVTLHTRSTVIPKIKVGRDSVINACSLIIRNVKPSCTMMGNPAREIFAPKRID